MIELNSDEYFMREALREAQKALDLNEVPVGAVIVSNNQIIARGHNLTEHLTDFTAHAEMQAYTAASEFLGNKYLEKCTLYVTLEPCPMCAGAAFWTRIGRIVFGAHDEKRGYTLLQDSLIHPSTEVKSGVLAEDCGSLLTEFFRNLRAKNKNK